MLLSPLLELSRPPTKNLLPWLPPAKAVVVVLGSPRERWIAGACSGPRAGGCGGLRLRRAPAAGSEKPEPEGIPRRRQAGESPQLCKMPPAHGATSESRGLERTRTPPTQPVSCAWRCGEHRGRDAGARGWSPAREMLGLPPAQRSHRSAAAEVSAVLW